jgi:hypothetical protein
LYGWCTWWGSAEVVSSSVVDLCWGMAYLGWFVQKSALALFRAECIHVLPLLLTRADRGQERSQLQHALLHPGPLAVLRVRMVRLRRHLWGGQAHTHRDVCSPPRVRRVPGPGEGCGCRVYVPPCPFALYTSVALPTLAVVMPVAHFMEVSFHKLHKSTGYP